MFPNTEKQTSFPDDGIKKENFIERTATQASFGQAEVDSPFQHTTKRGLKSRHAQMIAIAGTIGTGLFVGSGQALAVGGPASLLVGYIIISFLVYGVVTATVEMSAYLPSAGSSMAYYGSRYVSNSLGFAMGWLYWYAFAILVPYEITAASVVVSYWPNSVPVAAWITIFLVVVISLNCFPVRVYGEAEFWFASIKITTIIGLLILSFILFWGGGPNHARLGFHYWKDGHAAKEYLVTGSAGRFCAFLWSLIHSVFSFNFAPELMVITGGEMEAPRRNLPKAAKRYFYRLLIFYVLGSLAIGVICDSNSPKLTSGGVGAGASPWAVAIKNASISGLDSVINAAVMTSAWSSGNSYLYMSSRTLYSLAIAGNAPGFFKRCTKSGIPYAAVLVSCLFSLLAYLNVSSGSSQVFNWFINLTNTAAFTSWVCCCIIFFRFRKACAVQGVTNLPYRSRGQPYMAAISMVLFTILCLLNGFSVFFHGQWSISSFMTSYIGIPVFLVLYAGHKIYHWQSPWARPAEQVDLRSGLEEVELADAAVPVKEEKMPWLGKVKAIWE